MRTALVVGVVVALLLSAHGWLAVAGGALAGLIVWKLESLLFPHAHCWWCRGNPRYWNADGTAWRDCPVCRGSGRRRRPLAGGPS